MIIVLGLVTGWGLLTGNLVAAVPATFVIWVAWVYVSPFTDCRWCHGTGRHRLSGRRYRGACWNPRCQRGTVQRLGSKSVHRAVNALKDYHRQQRRK